MVKPHRRRGGIKTPTGEGRPQAKSSVRASRSWRQQIGVLLQSIAKQGVVVDGGAADRLEAYCRAVAEWSDRAGLVSPADLEHLVEKHVAPSIGALLVCSPRPGARWADVGTGAGLPGLVVKLCRPDLYMTLIESSRKKTIFLERVRADLGVPLLEIMETRVESLSMRRTPGVHGSPLGRDGTGLDDGMAPAHEVILMRAVANLGRSLELIDSIAVHGCKLLTFKGSAWRSEVEAAQSTLVQRGWVFVGAYEIPWAPPKVLVLERVLR
jgi:16S rRNA (guanine527-N7)-methyltransferase